MSESSLKENDSELLNEIGGYKVWCVSSARSDWLIAVCHSNLGDTFIASEVRSALFASESLLQYRKVCVLLGHFRLWVFMHRHVRK